MQKGIFKKSSMERISSPEKLNDYIQVSNPASWMILGAALALLLGLLAWGVFGKLTESAVFTGQYRDGQLHCYVPWESSESITPGMSVSIRPYIAQEGETEVAGTVAGKAELPVSYDEARARVDSDYLRAVLGITPWNIEVKVDPETPLFEDVVYAVTVVTRTYRPIELVFQ